MTCQLVALSSSPNRCVAWRGKGEGIDKLQAATFLPLAGPIETRDGGRDRWLQWCKVKMVQAEKARGWEDDGGGAARL